MDAAPPPFPPEPYEADPASPFELPPITVGTALSLAHTVLGSNYGLILGATLLVLLLQIVVSLFAGAIDTILLGPDPWVQPVSMAAQILILTPLAIGPGMIAATLFRHGTSDINTVFIGFTRYAPVVLIGLITSIAVWGASLIVGILAAVFFYSNTPAGAAIGILVIATSLIILIYFGIRFWFATLICVDPLGPRPASIESLAISWRITAGGVLTLFLLAFVLGLICLGCALLLVLPLLFYAMPLVAAATGVLYALLAHHSSLARVPAY